MVLLTRLSPLFTSAAKKDGSFVKSWQPARRGQGSVSRSSEQRLSCSAAQSRQGERRLCWCLLERERVRRADAEHRHGGLSASEEIEKHQIAE